MKSLWDRTGSRCSSNALYIDMGRCQCSLAGRLGHLDSPKGPNSADADSNTIEGRPRLYQHGKPKGDSGDRGRRHISTLSMASDLTSQGSRMMLRVYLRSFQRSSQIVRPCIILYPGCTSVRLSPRIAYGQANGDCLLVLKLRDAPDHGKNGSVRCCASTT
jgi:hypothetical protein